jgi:hypothetical protein
MSLMRGSRTSSGPTASPFGTPTRFGNVSAQPKLFLDLAGELWQ